MEHFDQEELKTLCFNLGVDYDSLPAEGKAAKARELVSFMSRAGRLPELESEMNKFRPHISRPDVSSPTTLPKASRNDSELRGIVLSKYYIMRKNGLISINSRNFGDEIELDEVFRISSALADAGLIEFRPLRGDDKIIAATGRIKNMGIDIVEGNAIPPIKIVLR